MTTTQEAKQATTQVPEILTDEHHEAIRKSWELPAYDREAPTPPKATSRKPLYVGLVAGALGLAIGVGVGYWAHSQTVPELEPFVITNLAGPTDANGMTLGRRVAPLATALPFGLTLGGPVDANGMPLGRRVAPLDTGTPATVAVPAVDANGLTLGRRIPPVDTITSSEIPGYSATYDSRIVETA